LVLGVGLGYRQDEAAAFGVTQGRARIFGEKLDVIRRLLEGERVTAVGTGYELRDAHLSLRPIQQPRPPIWVAANSEAGVRRAAGVGDAWIIDPRASLSELDGMLRLYRTLATAPIERLPVIREACVRESAREAF